MNEIKWKRRSTHNGTRVSYEARVGNRIVAQINLRHVLEYTVFQPDKGDTWCGVYGSVSEAKKEVEEWYRREAHEGDQK
jgi:hypothetical protein